MSNISTTKKQKKEEVMVTPTEILNGMLDAYPNDHFNFVKTEDFKISSGSLSLDRELGGGFGAGIHRFIGVREGGKTSCCLQVCKNFLEFFGKLGFVVYFKAEGRLDPDIFTRSGISQSDERFKVVQSNIYEFVIDSMRALVKDNPMGVRYLFVIDSVDGLITRQEMEKSAEEVSATASSARMLALLLKKISSSFSAKGHMGVFISQERSNIVINQYAPREQKQGNSSGGNAIQHYANFVLNFKNRTREDLIFEDEDSKGKILGHYCKVTLLKTVNDNTDITVKYPIRRKVGIWKELEVADACLEWEIYKKEKNSYKLSEDHSEILTLLKEKFGDKVPESLVGQKRYKDFFLEESSKEIVDFLFEYFKRAI